MFLIQTDSNKIFTGYKLENGGYRPKFETMVDTLNCVLIKSKDEAIELIKNIYSESAEEVLSIKELYVK